MNEKFVELSGEEKGATSVILIGVHGNEKCGIIAMEKILPTLKINKGRVLIGYGNPRAIDQDVRYTEANLNRMFKPDNILSEKEKSSYEYKRAQFIKKYLDQADALLDVHATSSLTSKPFLICENDTENIAKHLPFDLVVSGFDEFEPGGTDYYMNNNGKIGICAECGFLGGSLSAKVAQQTILVFLLARGHIRGDIKMYKQKNIKIYNSYITKTNKFTLTKEFENFEKIREGQLIGVDGEEKIRSPKKSLILFADNVKKIGSQAFLLCE